LALPLNVSQAAIRVEVSGACVSCERLNESDLMAENDRRSYRDSSRWRSAEDAAPAQTDDPLAELARLIGQSVPMDRVGRDRRPAAPVHGDDRPHQTERGAAYPAPNEVVPDAPEERYFAAEVEPDRQDIDDNYRTAADEGYEAIAEADPRAPLRASRFRHEPNFTSAPSRDLDDGAGNDAAYGEAADWHDRSSDERDSHYADEYEDEGHDGYDHGYDGEYSEDQNTGRRGGFVFVAAVFALAVLGTAGAFAYRTMFAGPAVPALPPIIKAEAGPNKIIPNDANSQDSAGRDNASGAGSRERLVSREERPVDIPPPVASTAPRAVATVPVFPDPPRMGGPGAVVGYSPSPPLSNAASAVEPPRVPSAAMTTATAPNPAPSVALAAPESSAPPPISAPTPGGPGPKKIRTVTIRSDQSVGADGPAGAAANAAIAPRSGSQSQTANSPLSIVPSSSDTPAPAARPRPAAPQPVPLNKPPANETASAAPMATASGGYAVQVSSQHSEEEAQSSFRALQAKYPDLLGGREPIIRRADLGAKGIYFRAMAGPYASADQANELCSKLKAAGGSCIVQKN
jgi:SPOR domain